MKKLIFMFLLWIPLSLSAQGNCEIKEQLPLKLMKQELERNFKILKKQKPPIYYISYTYTQGEEISVKAVDGGIRDEFQKPVADVEVSLRAGNPQMDNTRALRGEYSFSYGLRPEESTLSNKNSLDFLRRFWSETQSLAKDAQEKLSRVQANVRSRAENKDKSDDFVFPPLSLYCHEEPLQTFDLQKIKDLLVAVSRLTIQEKNVLKSSFNFSVEQGHRYFVDSVGTQLKTPYAYIRLFYSLYGRGKDGLEIERFNDYNVSTEKELPSLQQLTEDVRKSVAELNALAQAAEGEAANVPVILKGRAAAVFVHEVMGHRLEGDQLKDADDGQTLSGKVGQQVISPLITITADPTLTYFNGEMLRGAYEYDDEGVKSRPVVLIENGVLRNFMMRSTPIEGFPVSNGHGRKERGYPAAARMSVLRATASETVPYEKLEEMLLQEIKKQNKPFGFIVEDLAGGFTFTGASMPQSFKLETKMIYKVFPDGRKEVVRGLDVIGTPLVSFNRIIAAGNDDTVFNGSCGSVSGWVPQTNISPSLLFENMEFQKAEKSAFKPPVLPAPDFKQEEK
ncbi:MAG: hypothetical protein IJ311_00740 [Elusimicrobiaceae bacterium]|nr:hypothetical protein [Elusimicrobiaceae bacterium]